MAAYRAFAGIGSRDTPPDMLDLLRRASHWLVATGWTCRTGGAPGADTACEQGALQALHEDALVGPEHASHGQLEVYLPWPRFERGTAYYDRVCHTPDGDLNLVCFDETSDHAHDLAASLHPAWGGLTQGARKLHARNCYQILGYGLDRPVGFVLCWTKDGALGTPEAPVTKETGGTGQAIRLAAARSIEVMNLARPEHRDRVLAKIEPVVVPDDPTYTETEGDLLNLDPRPDAVVNTVNCKGAMGRGVALAFRGRYPAMYQEYRALCATKRILPGTIWPWRPPDPRDPLVLNMAVKDDWRKPARMEWIEAGLDQLARSYREWGLESVALPRIGAANGWLPWPPIHAMIKAKLGDLPGLRVTLVSLPE